MGTRTQGSSYQFYHLVPDLTLTPASSLSQGFLTFLPYLILLLVFAGATFAPMLLQQRNVADANQRRQTLIMSAFMTVFMLWIGWGSPAGVLLFWGVSSLFGVFQQQITMRALKAEDEKKEAEIVDVKPVKVEVERKVKKKRPHKSR
jgi:YidC/Oxa1 family membrane protein insertase